MSRVVKTFLTVAGTSLLLNLVWENLQAPLYQGYNNFWQHLPICFVASLGDVLIILVLYFVGAIIHRNIFWIAKMSRADVVLVITLGALIAVGIETWALQSGRWQYTSLMPLVSYVKIGLLPVMQLTLLPIPTFSLASKFNIYENHNV